MVRISKQAERRSSFPRKRKAPSLKTGPLAESLENGYKTHANAVPGDLASCMFVPKIK